MALSLTTGCASLSGEDGLDTRQLAVQYATLRVIADSDSIDKGLVLERIEQARTILDGEQLVSISNILDQVVSQSEWDGLDTLDKEYLTLLLLQVESASVEVDHVLDERNRVRLLTVLDWIEEAAKRAG